MPAKEGYDPVNRSNMYRMTNEQFKSEKQAIRKYFKAQGINIKLTQGKGTARMWLTITPTGRSKTDLQTAQKRAASLLYEASPTPLLDPTKIDRMQASGNLKVIQLSPPARWELIKAIKRDEAPKPKPVEEQAAKQILSKTPTYNDAEVQKEIDKDPSIKGKEAKQIHRLLGGWRATSTPAKKRDFDRQISKLFDGDKRKPRNKFK